MSEITNHLEILLEEHRVAEEKRILDRWDRIWDEYGTYCRGVSGKKMKRFPEWAKTSKYSLNDKL